MITTFVEFVISCLKPIQERAAYNFTTSGDCSADGVASRYRYFSVSLLVFCFFYIFYASMLPRRLRLFRLWPLLGRQVKRMLQLYTEDRFSPLTKIFILHLVHSDIYFTIKCKRHSHFLAITVEMVHFLY